MVSERLMQTNLYCGAPAWWQCEVGQIVWRVFLVSTLVALIGVEGSLVTGQTLSVQPPEAMMDERLAIKATNLKPHQPVVLRASVQDAEGKLWQSFAGFYANEQGAVNVATQAPVQGSYAGADAMGLIWSMNPAGGDYERARFGYRRAEPLTFKFTLESEGQTLASTEVVRRFMWPDARVIEVRENGLVGTLFAPAGAGPFPAVIVLGGSEGGLNSEDVAALLSSHGYAALALAYFGAAGLPSALEEIPLEYFRQAMDWLGKQSFVKSKGVSGGRLDTGGTAAANAQAQADSWPRVLKFLQAAFKDKP